MEDYIYTDDTEMAHVLANSLIGDKGFEPQRVVKRYIYELIVRNSIKPLS